VFDITPEIARGSFHRQTRQQMSANGKTDVPAKLQCMYIRWIHLGLGLTWTNERLTTCNNSMGGSHIPVDFAGRR
jgi:hypothetical protein